MTIKEALTWAKKHDIVLIIIETDCLVAVQAIQNSTRTLLYISNIINDCRKVLLSVSNVNLKFVKCSANRVGHRIAEAACSISDRVPNYKLQHLLPHRS